MAAFQHRLESFSPFKAARDTVLSYLMGGVATHCGTEGGRLLKDCFYECSDEAMRLRLLNAYAKTLPSVERADFLAHAMLNDPSEQVRLEARECFRNILLEGNKLGMEENRTISEKFAADKRELVQELLRKGDDDALSTLTYRLDDNIEVDRAILRQLVENSLNAELRDEAMEMLRRYEEGQEGSGDEDAK
jgi:hypothetical protein